MIKEFNYGEFIKGLEFFAVSQLKQEIKRTLEEDFSQVSVTGEISRFKLHVSGHWYFNLIDSDAVISCSLWCFNVHLFGMWGNIR